MRRHDGSEAIPGHWLRLLVRMMLAVANMALRVLAKCSFRDEQRIVKSIVVLRSSAIGDFICCLPALAHIRRAHPHARLHLLTMATATRRYRGDPRFVAGGVELGSSGVIDEVHLFDSTRLASMDYLREMRRRMRQLNADMVFVLPQTGVSFSGMLKKLLFLRVLGLKQNVTGYGLHQLGVLKKTQFKMGLYVHQVTTAMRAAGAGAAEPVVFSVDQSQKADRAVSRRWHENGLSHATNVVCLFIGAKFEHKRWPVENFAEICRRISGKLGGSLILVGGAQEASLAQSLQAMVEPQPINFTGRLSLLETAEVLRRCRMHVGNDSGPAHLAAAVGTQCVTITSGIVFPGIWEAWGHDNITVRHRVSCEYCFAESHCPRGTMECIRGISVDEVWQAVLVAWSRTSAKAL